MKNAQAKTLLYQALETERGGVRIYETALENAVLDGLVEEWQEYLEQTRTHVQRLLSVFEELGLDPEAEEPCCAIMRMKADSLVEAMKEAKRRLDEDGAQLVACECVCEAELKDHLNWSLLEHIVENGPKKWANALREPVEATLKEEAHHLFHTEGYARELWLKGLGFPAALPPPEEAKSVETKIGAGRAEHQRGSYV